MLYCKDTAWVLFVKVAPSRLIPLQSFSTNPFAINANVFRKNVASIQKPPVLDKIKRFSCVYKRTVNRYNTSANTYTWHLKVRYVLEFAVLTFLVYKFSIYPKSGLCQAQFLLAETMACISEAIFICYNTPQTKTLPITLQTTSRRCTIRA